MNTYVSTDDLYRFKLALILENKVQLNKLLQNYPTEKRLKQAAPEEIAHIISIDNHQARIIRKLKNLDKTYARLVTFRSNPGWSKKSRARRVMGIDTEYLKSDLDAIQYVILDDLEPVTAGFIFTNSRLAPSVSIQEGINLLRGVIYRYDPEIMVGHNFNSDISIIEQAYGDTLPELYCYDDTMELLELSRLANIIGGYSLNRAAEKLFAQDVINLFTAYKKPELLIKYGIKDALYPVLLREYILNGQIGKKEFSFSIDQIVSEKNRSLLDDENIKLTI